MEKPRKKTRIIIIISTCFIMIMIIIKPERYVKSVLDGVLIFGSSVLPALFPFFFFTRLLTKLNFANSIAKVTEKPISKLYKAPPISAYVFIMSILSGYPVGARILSDFYKNGVLSTDECKKISAFTSTSGPLFIIGTIGSFMLHDKRLGYIILVAHILSAFLNGIIYRNIKSSDAKNVKVNPPICDYDTLLADSINGAVTSILMVGGYIAIFNMIVDLAIDINLIGLISKPFEYLIFLFSPNSVKAVQPFMISIIEVTRGALEFSKLSLSKPLLTALIAGTVSMGGLSIAMQSLTYLSTCKIPASFYFKTKTTQTIIAIIIAYILAVIFIR